MLAGIGAKRTGTGGSSRRLQVTSIVHYEQAFFIRQIIAAAVPAVSLLVRHSLPQLMPAFYIVVAVTCLNLLYYWLTVTGRFRTSFKWVQIGIDMFLWTLLIHFTGGEESVFFFLYPLEILVAAFTLSASGCIYGAVLAGLFYTLDLVILGPNAGLHSTHAIRLLFLSAIAALSVLIVKKLEKKTLEVERLSEMLRERAESAETSLGAILDTLSSGLVIVNEKGAILSMNEPFAKMCGIPDGRPPSEIADRTPLHDVRAQLLELLNGEDGEKMVEMTLPRELAQHCKVRLNTQIFKRNGQRCIMAIAAENDYKTEKDEGASQSAVPTRVDLLQDVGEAAAVVAHEVKNSVTCIMGLLSLLSEDLSQRTESVGLLKKTVSAAEDLNRFVSDLLVYSRRVDPRFEKVDLVGVVDSATELVSSRLAGTKKVKLTRDFTVSRLEALVDPGYIQRALINLLINAYQAVGNEGSVSVLVRQEDGNAVIEVKDNGCGIPNSSVDRIFEPFFTTKGMGSGLGLAIVKKLVEAHRGRVSVATNLGVGTRLTVSIPLAQEEVELAMA